MFTIAPTLCLKSGIPNTNMNVLPHPARFLKLDHCAAHQPSATTSTNSTPVHPTKTIHTYLLPHYDEVKKEDTRRDNLNHKK